MLSDSCAEFIYEMAEHGITSGMYAELRRDILHYQRKPFCYPREICQLLVSAVDGVRRTNPSLDLGTFLRLLIATDEAYWDSSGEKAGRLPQTLGAIWPTRPKITRVSPKASKVAP